ncbi:uncharacterized protein PADG_12198 [Paracoccidioides brasiliensis Pb18]|uniref:PARP catalytic domain-containing protein n=1 Tax=Paracoccidioides brasiliensis (strain Pb18) TaxID=502780 RepID=A0A0A0HWI6_PARBD|nr:uncharacterized protein PADG_12198 [Paracoccidioides brasiliensis Pb18]KGM91740.1 hypothetical protein PADG_12198 [Paracoccidioides brasiliensis Pb18]
MPRCDFFRDLKEASNEGNHCMVDVRAGEDDGVISCTYSPNPSLGKPVEIQLLIDELSYYPTEHSSFVFTTSSDVPKAVTDALEAVQTRLSGIRIFDMLIRISKILDRAFSPNAGGEVDMSDIGGNFDGNCQWSPRTPNPTQPRVWKLGLDTQTKVPDENILARMAADLCTAKTAGFKRSLEEIIQEDALRGKVNIEFCADLCDSYKPSLQSAHMAFKRNGSKSQTTDEEQQFPVNEWKQRKMTRSFISKPLNTLLNERFIKILRSRYTFSFSWTGAEIFFNDVQGKALEQGNPSLKKYKEEESLASPSTVLPELLTADHLMERTREDASFPLIKCSSFSVTSRGAQSSALSATAREKTHSKLSSQWEIGSQPNVVDLLISFTYTGAKQNRLADFPSGMGILVPSLTGCSPRTIGLTAGPKANTRLGEYAAKFKLSKLELCFTSDIAYCPVRVGDWVAVCNPSFPNEQFHSRVQNVHSFPKIHLSRLVTRRFSDRPASGVSAVDNPSRCYYVTICVYNLNFDDLKDVHKRHTIMLLLETLPSVDEIRDFLENASEKAKPHLSDWRCKISKSALDVLRWIISSNRSCIIEDDHDSDRVSGMEAFMQFRFAQGAPDKEQRFVQAVVEAKERLPLKYPTIFAWHGSSFANWHGIVREGLHFKEIRHGRVFGNGVYMSSSFDVATYYTGAGFGSWPQSKLEISYAVSLNEVVNAPKEFVSKSPHLVVARLDWLQPRYLFVKCKEPESAMGDDDDDDDDADDEEEGEEEEEDNPFSQFPLTEPSDPVCHLQDPEYTARGPWGIPIKIPTTAVSRSRRFVLSAPTPELGTNHTDFSAKLQSSLPFHP